MKNWKNFPRVIFLFVLLTGLLVDIPAPALGNKSVSAAPMRAVALDVIISEVAWGGTAVNSAHEWIELYNTTNLPIDISGWNLVSSDGSPNIAITAAKIIPAHGYYLLESSADAPISNMTADQTYSGGLVNTGESLTLIDTSVTPPLIIDTANSGCTNCWYAGSASPNYYSMERILPATTDSAVAWTSNDGITRNGLDANGNPINGTPHNSPIDLALSINLKSITTGNATFTVTVTNMGYGTATNVSVKDDLPLGLTFVSYVSSVGTYDPTTGVGIWMVGALPTGASETLDITVTIPASGMITNWAEVWTSDQLDPDSAVGNGIPTEDDYDSIKIGPPIFGITNIVNNATPNVGSNIVFAITVSNTTAGNATGVQVDALLPVGLEYVSHAVTPAIPVTTYDSVFGGWNIGALDSGASMTLDITAKVTSSGTKNFSAEVLSIEFPNAIATATVNPVSSTQADLSLSQTWSRSTNAVGRADLKITVKNNDAVNTATNVQVRDLLPSGLDYVSHSTGKTYNSSTGIWDVGTLDPSGSSTLTIVVKVASSGTSTTNFAEIWRSDQFDPTSTPGNGDLGEDDDTSYPGASIPGPDVKVADLNVTQTVDIAGSNAVFSITVRNSGPDDATGVNVTTLLPTLTSAYTFVSVGATQGSYVPSTTVNGNNRGLWTVGGLASGASATLTITTNIVGSLLVNWVEVSSFGEVDPDSIPGNNSRTEDDDASAPSADLFMTQTVTMDNPRPDVGDNVVFTITVTNAGVAGTTNVQVKSSLPYGLTYVTDTAGTGNYNKTSGIWTVGTLDSSGPNSSRTFTVTAKIAANGIITNWAEVWRSDEADPDSIPGNGSTTEDDDAAATVTTRRVIVINEIAWSGTAANSEDEWIELYNPSTASISITGWTLKSNSGNLDITLSGTIAAGGYFLLERDNNFTVSDVAADQIYTGGTLNLLSDSGEVLILDDVPNDGAGNFIDTANAEGSTSSSNPWPKGSLASNYGSMERQGTSAEIDKSWVTNIGTPKNGINANNGLIYGTPRRVNSAGINPTPVGVPAPTTVALSGRVILNEFLARPGYDWNKDGRVDVFDEFIEIKNIGNTTISISGWKLDDEVNQGSSPFTLPAITLKVGERAVFYGLQTNILLSDGGDTVRLIDASGKISDSYTYSIAEVENLSVCRLPDGNGSWYEDCIPTPNLINTREGKAPAMPGGGVFESPVCELPDTLPVDFLFAECRGYGAGIWHSYYWDQFGWQGETYVPANMSKWESFVE